jgi:predicted DNA-binding protein
MSRHVTSLRLSRTERMVLKRLARASGRSRGFVLRAILEAEARRVGCWPERRCTNQAEVHHAS